MQGSVIQFVDKGNICKILPYIYKCRHAFEEKKKKKNTLDYFSANTYVVSSDTQT